MTRRLSASTAPLVATVILSNGYVDSRVPCVMLVLQNFCGHTSACVLASDSTTPCAANTSIPTGGAPPTCTCNCKIFEEKTTLKWGSELLCRDLVSAHRPCNAASSLCLGETQSVNGATPSCALATANTTARSDHVCGFGLRKGYMTSDACAPDLVSVIAIDFAIVFVHRIQQRAIAVAV